MLRMQFLYTSCVMSVLETHDLNSSLDHRPQATSGRVPENCTGAGGRTRAEAARLRQETAAGQVQN